MKRLFRIIFLSAVLVTVVLVACKRDKAPYINFGYTYYPNTVGKYIIYDVESIYSSSFDYKIDTVKYQLKELVQSLFPDNSGRPTQRIERYVKSYDSATWVLRNVCTANVTSTDAEKVENNVRYIKLVFPVALNKFWNGNAYNTLGTWNYSYTAVDQPMSINNQFFDSVLTVVQLGDSNVISDSLYIERYARNIGLVYKSVTAVTNDCTSLGTTGSLLGRQYTTGIFKYSLTINSHN